MEKATLNWTQIHLAVNHIAVVGIPLLLLLLAWAWMRRSAEVTRLMLWWIAGLSALSIVLKFTGDFAAEQAGDQLSEVRPFVDRHEQGADQAATGLFVLGLLAGAGIFAGRRQRPLPRWIVPATLAAGLLVSILLARTAHLGGQIGHPELRPTSTAAP
jgi:uncharacterized membrane protein